MSDQRCHPRAPRASRRGSVLVSLPAIPLAWAAAIALAALAAFAVPGTSESAATQPAAKVDPALGQIGWAATYGTGPSAIKSHTHWAAFALAENESPDPLVAPAAFQADFAGEVQVFETGKYRFRLDAEGGRASLKFYDKLGKEIVNVTSDGTSRGASVQSPWVELPAGPITASVKFARSASKPARLATYWECEMKFAGGVPSGFPLEPLPPPAVRVPKFASAAAKQAEDSINGRVLLGEYGCVHCHAVDTGDPSAFDRSGVFHRMGPALGEIGKRASPQWLQRWIMNPTQLKPGTHMPDVFGDTPTDAADAEAIVHFLVASHDDPKAAGTPATEESAIDRGRALFHTVGCVACHGPIESPAAAFKSDGLSKDTPPQHPVLGYGDLKGKWRPSALSEFLQNPQSIRPGGRMPSMTLTKEEADLIAAYLTKTWEPAPAGGFTVDPEKVKIGQAAFSARGCASCHTTGDKPPTPSKKAAKPLSKLALGKGCLDPRDTAAPRFAINDHDRKVITAAIPLVSKSVNPAPTDVALRTMEALSCRACHTIDGTGAPNPALKPYFRTADDRIDLGNEGFLPPNLTAVGWKLNTAWMHDLLTKGARARPYMGTRMPQFGEMNVGKLADHMAAQVGVLAGADTPEPKPTDEQLMAGRQLAGMAGLKCIECHTFDGKATIETTPGPEITDFAGRIRHEWWRSYVRSPGRYKPGTKMIAFFQTGSSNYKDLYAGDATKQIEALWAYFSLGEFAPAPVGLPSENRGLVLPVGDKPVVFRSFLKNAGSRGIAVGFPAGLHFAFDAASARLVEAWRGDFIDASGAWKDRGGGITPEKGDIVWNAPKGPALLIAGEKPAAWPDKADVSFKGYSLDAAGAPTFNWVQAGVTIAEKFEPVDAGKAIKRTFTIGGLPPGAKVWLNPGKGVDSVTVLDNVAEQGNVDSLISISARDAGKPFSFSVVIKP
ncbi:MAG: c-type cytochrome [Phycisphaerales bacterium]|nr:c-type cytochrome [Phycisphaerales bacterium]